jgi:hypothetical protein
MRITLDIANDVLHAARERAHRENKTVSEVISELARVALDVPILNKSATDSAKCESESIHGFRPFPSRGGVVTSEMVYALAEDED